MFILSILQTNEANTQYNSELGAYGFHYEILIKTAMTHAKSEIRSNITLDTIDTLIARIAFKMFNEERRRLSPEEINETFAAYEKEHDMRYSVHEMIRLLENARILGRDYAGDYMFQFQYIYYYFVAKFFATNLHTRTKGDKLRNRLENMAEKLYIEDYANIVIFLVYLTKDEQMIEAVVRHARTLYANHEPCDFDTHISFINKLNSQLPAPRFVPDTVDKNNEEHRSNLDLVEEYGGTDLDTNDYTKEEELSDTLKIHAALKTLQVMGQILRNFPGALQGQLKLEIATESYLLGLRTLRAIFSIMNENLDDLRSFLAEMMREIHLLDNEHSQEKAQVEATRLADHLIFMLVFGASIGLVRRVSHAVGSEHLSETYKRINHDPSPLAMGLIEVTIKLDHFQSFPKSEVLALHQRTKNKSFATRILQELVAHHFHLYHSDQRLRHSICDHIGIKPNTPAMLLTANKHRSKENKNLS